ncbi:MAG: hypothetical protein N3D11_13810 [Candidatus Sumerlaeia bacterium]|nr:hypothetical protein [Candidatus Sumerlaeia bacterium]
MIPIGDTLAAMGSRLAIIFDPVGQQIFYPRYGAFDEIVADLAIGIRLKSGETRALPFTRRYAHFAFVEQTNTMNSITYTGLAPDLGIKLTARFTTTFYPRDERLSTAPILLLDLSVERPASAAARTKTGAVPEPVGEIFFELESPQIRTRTDGLQVRLSFQSQPHENRQSPAASRGAPLHPMACEDFIFPHTGGLPLRADARANGFVSAFDLRKTPQSRPVQLTWCAYTTDAVLDLFGERRPFKYTEFFKTEDDLIHYIVLERFEMLCRVSFFDDLFQNTGLGKTYEDLVAFGFHSFLLNTWWTLWDHGRDWFSVWQGSNYFHSPLNVEYNNALLYLALWPELLERLLRQWACFEESGVRCLGKRRGAATSCLPHDMGSGARVGQAHYHHAMEVEDVCNYLLLAHTHWRWTAISSIVKDSYKLVKRLTHFLIMADTTGEGVPDKGVACAIDDGPTALQFGREQAYLGFKTLAALEKGAEIAQLNRDAETARLARKQAARLRDTLDEKGWMVDHYAVTLGPSVEGVTDIWKGRPVRPQDISGWDAYSIYTANGLLYPFLAATPVRVNTQRLSRDITTAMTHTQTEYGCTHTSEGTDRVWISQNLWRDFVAAYLDVDILNNADRYWAWQIAAGRGPTPAGFCDAVGGNVIFDSRGATAIGVFFAVCRFQLDRIAGKCSVEPICDRLDVPLLVLARWDLHQVPRLSVHRYSGQRHIKVSYRNCLRDLELTVIEPE